MKSAALLLVLALPLAAHAGEPALDLSPASFRNAPPADDFGVSGTWWWSVGGGVADDFTESTDVNAFVAAHWFIARNVEMAGELGVWSFSQPDEDAYGINPNILLRWHFLNNGRFTLFADIGIGMLFSTDDVPHRGTKFNFTPRVGGGLTCRLFDTRARLEIGLRWHHVSNARLFGNDDNPGRDAAMIYAGVIFPF